MSNPSLAEQLAHTLLWYEENAVAFQQGTWDHDVSQNVQALLDHLPSAGPHTILDLGCGPGRDLITFKRLGHHPIGLDGALNFVKMARYLSGCEVWHQDFLNLDLPPARFDGVFANASLFHVPAASLPDVLARLHQTLKPSGVLFASNPRGENAESFWGGRFGCFMDYHAWRDQLTAACFSELTHYYRPSGKPRHEQPWLASAWRREDPVP